MGEAAATASLARREVIEVRVHEVMSPAVVTVTPGTTVLAARRLLEGRRIRHLPVVEGDTLVGIVSDRDLAAAGARGAPSTSTPSAKASGRDRTVETVMTTPVRSVWPDDDVLFAARQMLSWKIDALPVTTDGRLVGILTSTDLLQALVAAVESKQS